MCAELKVEQVWGGERVSSVWCVLWLEGLTSALVKEMHATPCRFKEDCCCTSSGTWEPAMRVPLQTLPPPVTTTAPAVAPTCSAVGAQEVGQCGEWQRHWWCKSFKRVNWFHNLLLVLLLFLFLLWACPTPGSSLPVSGFPLIPTRASLSMKVPYIHKPVSDRCYGICPLLTITQNVNHFHTLILREVLPEKRDHNSLPKYVAPVTALGISICSFYQPIIPTW